MRMNIDRLLSLVNEVWFAQSEYRLACISESEYDFDNVFEKRDKYKALVKAVDCQDAVQEVLKMDREQCERLRIAARAVNKLNEKWDWTFSIDDRLARQLGDWIFGEKSLYHWEQSKRWGNNTWSWDHDRRVLLKFEPWFN